VRHRIATSCALPTTLVTGRWLGIGLATPVIIDERRGFAARRRSWRVQEFTDEIDIHPQYHYIKVVMTDGTEFLTRSTYGAEGTPSTSTSIRQPIRPGPAARSNCSIAAAACRASIRVRQSRLRQKISLPAEWHLRRVPHD